MAIYVDTSALIAMREAKDRRHDEAVSAFKRLVEHRDRMRVGRHTFIEFLDGVAARQGQRHAATAASQLLSNRAMRVVPSEPVFAKALDLFDSHLDWNVDLSDCLSFALMQALGIRRAFTYDRDFAKAGFEMIG